ncbi:MAG: hypothetical protein AAB013_01795 [Planctomycetota bacterium]
MKYHKLPYDTLWIPDKPIGVAYMIKWYDLTIIGRYHRNYPKLLKKDRRVT